MKSGKKEAWAFPPLTHDSQRDTKIRTLNSSTLGELREMSTTELADNSPSASNTSNGLLKISEADKEEAEAIKNEANQLFKG